MPRNRVFRGVRQTNLWRTGQASSRSTHCARRARLRVSELDLQYERNQVELCHFAEPTRVHVIYVSLSGSTPCPRSTARLRHCANRATLTEPCCPPSSSWITRKMGGVGQACNTLRRWVKPNKPIPTNPVKNRTTVEGSGTVEGGPPPFVTGSVDPVILERPTRYCHPGHNRNPAISKGCGLRPNQQTSHPLVEKRVKGFVPNFDLLIVHAFTIA